MLAALSFALVLAGAEPSYDVERARAASQSLTGAIAEAMAERPSLEVLSAEDMRDMLSLEATRAMAGCDEQSCLNELTEALGARYVVTAKLQRLAQRYEIALALFDSERAEVVARASSSDDVFDDLVEKVPGTVQKLLRRAEGLDGEPGADRVRVLVTDVEVAPAVFPLRVQEGLGPMTVGSAQMALGVCGACVMGGVPVLNCPSILLAPLACTFAQIFLGDVFGKERSVVVWPTLIALAVSLCTGGIGFALFTVLGIVVVVSLAAPIIIAAVEEGRDTLTPAEEAYAQQRIGPALWAFSYLSTFSAGCGAVLSQLTVPFAYAWFAERKGPADTGDGFPGWLEPSHAELAPGPSTTSGADAVAFAY